MVWSISILNWRYSWRWSAFTLYYGIILDELLVYTRFITSFFVNVNVIFFELPTWITFVFVVWGHESRARGGGRTRFFVNTTFIHVFLLFIYSLYFNKITQANITRACLVTHKILRACKKSSKRWAPQSQCQLGRQIPQSHQSKMHHSCLLSQRNISTPHRRDGTCSV